MRGLYFAALRKFHDTELLFGRFRVSIHDFPSIPRRIDANVTGVTGTPLLSETENVCHRRSSYRTLPSKH